MCLWRNYPVFFSPNQMLIGIREDIRKSCQAPLTWDTLIRSKPSHHIFPQFDMMSSPHPCTDLTGHLSFFFLPALQLNFALISFCVLNHFIIFFHCIALITYEEENNNILHCVIFSVFVSMTLSWIQASCLSARYRTSSVDFHSKIKKPNVIKTLYCHLWYRMIYQKCFEDLDELFT